MNDLTPHHRLGIAARPQSEPVRNLSRRGFLGIASGALLLGIDLSKEAVAQTRAEGPAAVAAKPGTRVAAFLEIRPNRHQSKWMRSPPKLSMHTRFGSAAAAAQRAAK